MKLSWLRGTLILATLAAAPGVALARSSDAWLTAKTKMALLTADGVDGLEVNVDTVRGRVTLHGKVDTEPERKRAEEVARKIDGVVDVRNLVQVVADPSEKRVEASDDQIKKSVESALKADDTLQNSHIEVKSVNKGVVLLGGKASSLTDQLAALRSARSVPGVVQVASEIQSPDRLADEEIWRAEKREPASAKSASAGQKLKDMWITSAVKMHLLANGDTPAMDINVDTNRAVVTLFGIVPSAEAKTAAATSAEKVDGVNRVVNALQVVPKSQQEAVKESDAEITKRVKHELKSDESLSDADINVEVKDQVVRLTGTVRNNADRLEAALGARSVSGVRAVREELRIETAQASKK